VDWGSSFGEFVWGGVRLGSSFGEFVWRVGWGSWLVYSRARCPSPTTLAVNAKKNNALTYSIELPGKKWEYGVQYNGSKYLSEL